MSTTRKTPKLRFPEFTDDWEQRKLSDYLFTSKEKNVNNKYGRKDVYSVSGEFGVVNQIEFQGRSFAGKTLDGYDVIHKGEVVYTKSPLKSNPYGIIKTNKRETGIVSTLYAVYKPKDTCFANFVEDYFNSDSRTNRYLSPLISKGAKNTINVSDDKALDGIVIFPSTEEQRKISTYFEKLNNLITLHQRELDSLKKLKKSLLQKMFPKNGEKIPELRFPEFTGDWEQRKLGELVNFLDTQRKPLEESKRKKGPYPYYGASGIVDYVSDYIFDRELILLSEDGANITDRNYPVCFLASGKYWVNNHAHVLECKAENDNNFICISLERKDFKKFNTGMAMPKLNKETCKIIPVSCTSLEEQTKIGNFFRELETNITLHQRELDTLKKLKKGLLQNMFV